MEVSACCSEVLGDEEADVRDVFFFFHHLGSCVCIDEGLLAAEMGIKCAWCERNVHVLAIGAEPSCQSTVFVGADGCAASGRILVGKRFPPQGRFEH